ncbi:MAG: FAD:protein FMN transferase [Pseudomonadota bacterium]
MAGGDDLVRRAQPWFGTIVEIAVPRRQEAAIEAGLAAISHVHARMSYHDAGSDLEKLRFAGVGEIVAVDPETVRVLRFAATLHSETAGLFDVAVGCHLVAAGFLPERGRNNLSTLAGSTQDLQIVDDTHVVFHAPLLIDLGGIAKGHGVDLAVAALIAAGCDHGIVNAGGDLRVFGDVSQAIWLNRADGGLTDPISVTNMAVATSSNRHTRARLKGRLVTPHIGHDQRPVIANHAVTIVAPTCIIADALTKVALADPELANTLFARYGAQMIIPESLRRAA